MYVICYYSKRLVGMGLYWYASVGVFPLGFPILLTTKDTCQWLRFLARVHVDAHPPTKIPRNELLLFIPRCLSSLIISSTIYFFTNFATKKGLKYSFGIIRKTLLVSNVNFSSFHSVSPSILFSISIFMF